MKMMLKRKQKQLKFILPPEKEAGKVLEGELARPSERTCITTYIQKRK